jgi:hypothetical protein
LRRISFEHKRYIIDLREKEKKEADEKAKAEKTDLKAVGPDNNKEKSNEDVRPDNEKIQNMKEEVMENQQFESIQVMENNKDLPKIFDFINILNRNFNFKISNKIDPKEVIHDPIIKREEYECFVIIKTSKEYE